MSSAAALASGRSDSGSRSGKILGVATELFAEHGYRAVGMRAIAEGVGIRTSSLYHHFSSKEEILHRIALEVTREFIAVQLPLLDAPQPAAWRLSELVRRHVVHFWERRREEAVALRELRELSPEHGEEIRVWRRRYHRRIAEVIAEGMAAGEFDVRDASVAAMALVDLVHGINRWYRPEGGHEIERLAELYVDMAIGGLLGGGKP